MVLPLLGFAGLFVEANELRSEEAFSRWAVRPANSAQYPVPGAAGLTFDAPPDPDAVTPGSLMSEGIQQTAYQSQYPLSKDSADLLPAESRLQRDSMEDSDTMPSDLEDPDALFDDSAAQPWIVW